MQEIDFVVLWVDGSDPEWLKEKNKYAHREKGESLVSLSDARFRDWGIFKYWFRAVEKYAPWVHKVHLVTYGHLPDFLNVKSDKLNVVTHNQIMEASDLPTFSSCAIEVNIGKIPGLAEKFVYFNDDMFLTSPVKPEDFFVNDLPVLEGLQGAVYAEGINDSYPHQILNSLDVINKHFSKRVQMKQNWCKWFNFHYGADNLRNLCLLPWRYFTGFKNAHLPVPCLKTTFNQVWKEEGQRLQATSSHKFRSFEDLNQYVFRYWQLASGEFVPGKVSGQYFPITMENLTSITEAITKQTYKMVCLNDGDISDDFSECQKKLSTTLAQVLSGKSIYEK